MPIDIDVTLQNILQEQAAMREQINGISGALSEQRDLTKAVQTLTLTVRDLANAQSNLSGSVGCIKSDVDELKGKPAKRWESVVSVIITAIVTAAITYILTQTGLK